MSHVTCHVSHVEEEKNGQIGGASRSRVCYQRGLPRLVFFIFIIEGLSLLGQINTFLFWNQFVILLTGCRECLVIGLFIIFILPYTSQNFVDRDRI